MAFKLNSLLRQFGQQAPEVETLLSRPYENLGGEHNIGIKQTPNLLLKSIETGDSSMIQNDINKNLERWHTCQQKLQNATDPEEIKFLKEDLPLYQSLYEDSLKARSHNTRYAIRSATETKEISDIIAQTGARKHIAEVKGFFRTTPRDPMVKEGNMQAGLHFVQEKAPGKTVGNLIHKHELTKEAAINLYRTSVLPSVKEIYEKTGRQITLADFHTGNVLLDKETGKITHIDLQPDRIVRYPKNPKAFFTTNHPTIQYLPGYMQNFIRYVKSDHPNFTERYGMDHPIGGDFAGKSFNQSYDKFIMDNLYDRTEEFVQNILKGNYRV